MWIESGTETVERGVCCVPFSPWAGGGSGERSSHLPASAWAESETRDPTECAKYLCGGGVPKKRKGENGQRGEEVTAGSSWGEEEGAGREGVGTWGDWGTHRVGDPSLASILRKKDVQVRD